MSDPDDFEVAEERLMSVFTYASTSGDYTTIYTVELDSLLEERDALRAERDEAQAKAGQQGKYATELARQVAELTGYEAQVARLEEALREAEDYLRPGPARDPDHAHYVLRNALSQDTESPRCPTCGLTQMAWIGTWPRSCPDDFHTESPRPANCDCGCSPPGPGLHYANCPAATAALCPTCGSDDPRNAWTSKPQFWPCWDPFHQSDTESG